MTVKAPEVHKLLRYRLLPFLHEHGFTTGGEGRGRAVRKDGVATLRLRYNLSTGNYAPIGGTLDFEGWSFLHGRLAATFHTSELTTPPATYVSLMHPDDARRWRARCEENLERILTTPLSDLTSAQLELLEDARPELQEDLRRCRDDASFQPTYRYTNAGDVTAWATFVARNLPRYLQYLEKPLRAER